MRNRKLILTIVSLALLAFGSIAAAAQSTEFTYQGRLTDGGVAPTAPYDLQFELFDAINNGNQKGSTITVTGVPVTDGVFTVKLDFGLQFDGNARYLQMSVKSSGSPNQFTALNPRQGISSAPYAVRSKNAATADNATDTARLGGINADQYVLTTDPRLNGTPGNFIQNTTSQQTSANFNISGSGAAGYFTAFNTIAGNQINSLTDYYIGSQRVLSVAGSSNTFGGINTGTVNTGSSNSFFGKNAGGINSTGSFNSFFGFNAGAANTTAINNSFFGQGAGFKNNIGANNTFIGNGAGLNITTAGNNTFVGSLAGQFGNGTKNTFLGYASGNVNSGNGNTYLGYLAGGSTALNNAAAIGQNAFVAQDNSVVLGSITGVNGATADALVGVGTTTPETKLHVLGSDQFGHFPLLLVEDSSVNGAGIELKGTSSGADWVINSGGNSAFDKSLHIRNRTTSHTAIDLGDGSPLGGGTTIYDFTEFRDKVRLLTLGNGGNTQLCLDSSNNTVAHCSSSLRYKKDLQPFTGGLALIDRLTPITFRWKSSNMLDLGFGAEDVAKVEPLLVSHNEKGEVEGVKYDRISAALVNAVKEQQGQIERQNDLIQKLETRLSQVESKRTNRSRRHKNVHN